MRGASIAVDSNHHPRALDELAEFDVPEDVADGKGRVEPGDFELAVSFALLRGAAHFGLAGVHDQRAGDGFDNIEERDAIEIDQQANAAVPAHLALDVVGLDELAEDLGHKRGGEFEALGDLGGVGAGVVVDENQRVNGVALFALEEGAQGRSRHEPRIAKLGYKDPITREGAATLSRSPLR